MTEIQERFFYDLPQQGPGSDYETLKALAYVKQSLQWDSRILDIGCGTGRDAFCLAENTDAAITAVDRSKLFLEKLNYLKGERSVETLCADMRQLDLPAESFDVVWAEGAAPKMGFLNAIKAWYGLIKPQGYLVLTDLVWMGMYRPYEVTYFQKVYPQMSTASSCLAALEVEGYRPIASFSLSDHAWRSNFYDAIARNLPRLEREHPEERTFARVLQKEMQLRADYAEYYNMVFFIAQKI
ncbi:MAG: methyltransferase domain-containing protein [Prevotella sp.]|nr:methyltransferase domain-containing protein [Prevotella sp.]